MTRVRPVTPWENAVSELAGWLAEQLPGLTDGRARALVEQAVGHGGPHARTLLDYVHQRPAALADPAPLLPPLAVRLAHALHREGYVQVVLPRCARCGRAPAR